MADIIKGAGSFTLEGGSHCVLLIHGFSGSTSEMRWLAEHLQKNGYSVFAVRLPGHGTSVEDLDATTHGAWLQTVVDAQRDLAAKYDRVSVVGMSMGALLAVHVAVTSSVYKIVLLAAPIYNRDWRLPFFKFFAWLLPSVPKKLHDYGLENHVRYDRMPLKAVGELLKLVEYTKGVLADVRVPTLVMQSRVEHTLKPQSAQYIYDALGCEKKKIFWLEHSGHLLVLGVERGRVFKEIVNFLQE